MSKFNFCGPSYQSQSTNADAQQTMNWYPEQIESGDGNTNLALYPTPGLKSFIDLTPIPPSGGIQNIRVNITSSQLINSALTPIQLIGNQGANLVIIALSAVIQYRFVSATYSFLNPCIGLGSSVPDVQASYTIQPQRDTFKASENTMAISGSLASWNNLPPPRFANQPLMWVDLFDPSTDTGDGTVTVNILYYVLNVVTGAIVGGTGKVHSTITQISTAQFKAANTVPISLIPAPGSGLLIAPVSLVVWHHFNTTAMSETALPAAGYGSASADIILTQIFHELDSDAFRLSADSMEQQFSDYNPLGSNIVDAQLINQPLSWVNTLDISMAAGDTTATVYMQYLVINPSTGDYVQGTGTLLNKITQVPASAIKAGHTVGIEMAPAPGANLLIVEAFGVAQCNFVSSSYASPTPSPRISPGPTAADSLKLSLLPLHSAGGGFTLWDSSSTQMFLERAINYEAQTTFPGAEIPPATVINQPATWADFVDCSASTADSTATINLSYLILNTSTGDLS